MTNIPTEPYRWSRDNPDEETIRQYAEQRAAENRLKRPVMEESALRTPEEVEANVAICQTCEYLVGDICVKFSKLCGCTGRHRTRIKSITCPEGKWQ